MDEKESDYADRAETCSFRTQPASRGIEKERLLMELLMNHEANPEDLASAWRDYFVRDEQEAMISKDRKNYVNNIFRCIKEVVNRSGHLDYNTGKS